MLLHLLLLVLPPFLSTPRSHPSPRLLSTFHSRLKSRREHAGRRRRHCVGATLIDSPATATVLEKLLPLRPHILCWQLNRDSFPIWPKPHLLCPAPNSSVPLPATAFKRPLPLRPPLEAVRDPTNQTQTEATLEAPLRCRFLMVMDSTGKVCSWWGRMDRKGAFETVTWDERAEVTKSSTPKEFGADGDVHLHKKPVPQGAATPRISS